MPLLLFDPSATRALDDRLKAVNLDVPATVFDLADIDGYTDGTSLYEAGSDFVERKVLIENFGYLEYKNNRHYADVPVMVWSGVSTYVDKIIEYADERIECYDLHSDPLERNNLALSTQHQDCFAELQSLLSSNRGVAIISNLGAPRFLTVFATAQRCVVWREAGRRQSVVGLVPRNGHGVAPFSPGVSGLAA